MLSGGQFSGLVLGHEIAGIIEEFGQDSRPEDYSLQVGDHVLVYPWIGCEECNVCLSGQTNECANNPLMFNTYGGGPIHPGGYSTHVIVHKLGILVKVPNTIPPEIACTLPCSALTAFTALKKARLFLESHMTKEKSGRLLIVGAGGLGLWCIQLARLVYATANLEITVADIASTKLETAKMYGADATIVWKTKLSSFSDYVEEASRTTRNNQQPFDAAIDFVGLPDTFNVAYRCLRSSGSVISVGLYGGIVDLPLIELVVKKLHIQGNYVGTLQDMKELINLLKNKDVNYSAIEFTKLDDINDTFDRLRKGQITGRAVVKF